MNLFSPLLRITTTNFQYDHSHFTSYAGCVRYADEKVLLFLMIEKKEDECAGILGTTGL